PHGAADCGSSLHQSTSRCRNGNYCQKHYFFPVAAEFTRNGKCYTAGETPASEIIRSVRLTVADSLREFRDQLTETALSVADEKIIIENNINGLVRTEFCS